MTSMVDDGAPAGAAIDQRAVSSLASHLGTMDAAKAAGLIVIGAVGLLAVMRKSFGGVNVRIGD